MPRAASIPAPFRREACCCARRGTGLGCGGGLGGRLSFISPLVSLLLADKSAKSSVPACCGSGYSQLPLLLGPWRSERSHTRQTSDRAASGKPWPNYCSPGDCFNLLHNIVQRDRAHHITSCPRAAVITAPKIPPLPHTWHGPGWWDQATPTAPYHSERRLPGCPGW